MSAQIEVVKATEAWLKDVVIGLNLCPFARKPHKAGQISYVVSEATDDETLMADLLREFQRLDNLPAQQLETTLLIIPHYLHEFLDFNQFLNLADWLLDRQEYTGIYQLATFHPHYQFADTAPEDPENLTNRAPYPILHILREDSMEKALANYPNPESIPDNNVRRVSQLSKAELRQLFPYLFKMW